MSSRKVLKRFSDVLWRVNFDVYSANEEHWRRIGGNTALIALHFPVIGNSFPVYRNYFPVNFRHSRPLKD
jgi:hypothetical protein